MASPETFKRMLEERFREFSEKLDQLIAAIGDGKNHQGWLNEAKEVNRTAGALADVLATGDRPTWLITLRQDTYDFQRHTNSGAGRKLLNTLLHFRGRIAPIDPDKSLPKYAFDRAFEELKVSHSLPELFDRLAAEITEIIDNGDVDSTVAMEALRRMAAALKENRNGSFWSMLSALVSGRFLWNLASEAAKESKAIKIASAAVEKTLNEAESDLKAVEKELQAKAAAMVIADWPKLMQLASSLEAIKGIAGPAGPEQDGDNIIDGEGEVIRRTDANGNPIALPSPPSQV